MISVLGRNSGIMISSVFSETCAYALMAEVGSHTKAGPGRPLRQRCPRRYDYATFEASTAAIVPYLTQMFEQGTAWESHDYQYAVRSPPSYRNRGRKSYVRCHRWRKHSQGHDFFHGHHCSSSRSLLPALRTL